MRWTTGAMLESWGPQMRNASCYTTIAAEYDPKSHADYLREIVQRLDDENYGDWHERGRDISNLKMVTDRLIVLQKEWMDRHNRDYAMRRQRKDGQ